MYTLPSFNFNLMAYQTIIVHTFLQHIYVVSLLLTVLLPTNRFHTGFWRYVGGSLTPDINGKINQVSSLVLQ